MAKDEPWDGLGFPLRWCRVALLLPPVALEEAQVCEQDSSAARWREAVLLRVEKRKDKQFGFRVPPGAARQSWLRGARRCRSLRGPARLPGALLGSCASPQCGGRGASSGAAQSLDTEQLLGPRPLRGGPSAGWPTVTAVSL